MEKRVNDDVFIWLFCIFLLVSGTYLTYSKHVTDQQATLTRLYRAESNQRDFKVRIDELERVQYAHNRMINLNKKCIDVNRGWVDGTASAVKKHLDSIKR